MSALWLALLLQPVSDPPPPAPTMREAVCARSVAVMPGDGFGLLTLPGPNGLNETGVLLLINCSGRRIVSLRDPSTSRRHLTRFVYDPHVRRRFGKDPHRYEFVNFNERAESSFVEENMYSKNTYWRGPCRYEGLQLTTAAGTDDADLRTITFDVDICRNMVLALIVPTR